MREVTREHRCRVVVFHFWQTVLALIGAAVLLCAASFVRGDESSGSTLLAFHATWCGPCRQMEPAVEQLINEGYVVQKVDVDQYRALAEKYNVFSLPMFVILENKIEVDRITGQTTIERLKAKLHREKRQPVKPDVRKGGERQPSPAWRYENPVGHRAAVVRIYCKDTERIRSIGSGTLVRWGAKKIVVLTANHVIKDAKSILIELFNKKTYRARVIKVDRVWDCAVLEVSGLPVGVEAVNVELGDPAMQKEGNRLESCGYGPDGKLAANSGLFLGYKRSSEKPNGPDDWFEISGHARQGDSGGGIFNEKGRLVGVLWGTDGQVVVGVQAGRIHVLLDAATNQTALQRFRIVENPETHKFKWCFPSGDYYGAIYENRQEAEQGASDYWKRVKENKRGWPKQDTLDPEAIIKLQHQHLQAASAPVDPNHYTALQFLQRKPTPAKPAMPIEDLPPYNPNDCGPNCGPNGCPLPGPVAIDETAASKKPLLPWRGDTQNRDDSQDARIDALIRLGEQKAREPAPAKPEVGVVVDVGKPAAKEPSPIGVAWCIIGAIAAGFVFYYVLQKK